MALSLWIINAAGLFLIAVIAWYFWGPKKSGSSAEVGSSGYQEIQIRVKGGYAPNTIFVQAGKPLRLEIVREEKTACSEMIVFPDFQKSMVLPYGKRMTIELMPDRPGSYPFTCQMGMYRGTMVVKD